MAKFRKKPVVVEAMQYTGENVKAVEDFGARVKPNGHWDPGETRLRVTTLEGWTEASPGDWIIKGVKGEFYPCKPDIFEMTYETVGRPKEEIFEDCMVQAVKLLDRFIGRAGLTGARAYSVSDVASVAGILFAVHPDALEPILVTKR